MLNKAIDKYKLVFSITEWPLTNRSYAATYAAAALDSRSL